MPMMLLVLFSLSAALAVDAVFALVYGLSPVAASAAAMLLMLLPPSC